VDSFSAIEQGAVPTVSSKSCPMAEVKTNPQTQYDGEEMIRKLSFIILVSLGTCANIFGSVVNRRPNK
jgi:hypothetical protein